MLAGILHLGNLVFDEGGDGLTSVMPTPATHAIWKQLKAGETNAKIVVLDTYNGYCKTVVLQPLGVQTVSDCPAFHE